MRARIGVGNGAAFLQRAHFPECRAEKEARVERSVRDTGLVRSGGGPVETDAGPESPGGDSKSNEDPASDTLRG